MLGDDFFNEMERAFAGGTGRRSRAVQSGDASDLPVSKLTVDGTSTIVFDFSGDSIVEVEIVDRLIDNGYGEMVANGEKALQIKRSEGGVVRYPIARGVKKQKMDWKFTNGILEVSY
ncbi:MAG: hypothetical protein ACI83O_000230 [Patescibacteria group bacterium]|jgi:hypothetical protein